MIELLEPTGVDSPVYNFLQKGGGFNHICYEVDNMDEAISKFARVGHRQISKPEPAVAFDNRKVTFFYTNENEIVELLEV
jgi:methylmalonyl-CoA/ethylmalonyl-CoA epimerase